VRIQVNSSQCQCHAQCTMVDEALFPLDEEGYSAADGTEVPLEKETAAGEGEASCPQRAISLVD
jgi:ferredoxin